MFSCKIQILDLYICRWDFWSPFSDSHSQAGSNSLFLVTAATIEVFLKRNFWNQPWILSLQVFRGHWLAFFPNVLINDFISYVIIIINTNILASRTYHVQSLSQGVPAHYRTKDGGHQIGFGGLVTIISLPAWSPSSRPEQPGPSLSPISPLLSPLLTSSEELNCVTQLMLYTGEKLSSPIFCCLCVRDR